MKEKIHNFIKYTEEADQWEKLTQPLIEKIFLSKLKHIDFKDKPEIQKRGIDFISNELSIELKIRDYFSYKYKDILFETMSIREENKLGWVYTSQADCVLYCWKNKKGTDLIDGYVLLIQDENFKEWFNENKSKYEEKVATTEKEGKKWHTINIAIPIVDLLSHGFIIQFNPKLKSSEYNILNIIENQNLLKKDKIKIKKTNKKLKINDFM